MGQEKNYTCVVMRLRGSSNLWVWLPFRFVSRFVSFLDLLAPKALEIQMHFCGFSQHYYNYFTFFFFPLGV